MIEEYDVAQYEADVEYLKSWLISRSVLSDPQVDHDGGRTLAVGELAEPSAASDALGAQDRRTILSHVLLSTYILDHARLCTRMGAKQTCKWCFEIEKRKPDQINCHLP